MTEQLAVHAAVSAVMDEVRQVKKGDFNQQQRYSFRGVDAVINAVGPALRKHKVIVLPELISERMEKFETSKGSTMYRSVVAVAYRFIGPAGDTLRMTVAGEGSDSLDKATSKAMSVAYRTMLIQALCLPTDEPDPDSFSPPAEPSAENTERSRIVQAKSKVWKLACDRDWSRDDLAANYRSKTGRVIGEATAAQLYEYARKLEAADVE